MKIEKIRLPDYTQNATRRVVTEQKGTLDDRAISFEGKQREQNQNPHQQNMDEKNRSDADRQNQPAVDGPVSLDVVV